MLPAADHAGEHGSEDGREPEQPELGEIGTAGKQGRAGASRRIDRSVGDRDQEEVDQREAEPDRYAGEADGSAFRGGAVSTVSPKAKLTPRNPMPSAGNPAARTALPQPANVSQKVPKNSAPRRRGMSICVSFLLPIRCNCRRSS
jgi:hypothetical protein